MKVLVLQGGDSPEHEVSLKSAEAVIEGLKQHDYEIKVFDPSESDGFETAVNWADVVLPIVHGVNCEDGKLQKKLEELGARYLGSDSKSSENCFDMHELTIKIVSIFAAMT